MPVVLLTLFGGPYSISGDEALTTLISGSDYGTAVETVSRDNHPPGYYSYLWVWIRLFGNSLTSLRLSSTLCVAIMILAAMKHLPGKAALFIAISPFTAHLALEVRMYGMLAMWGLLLMIVLDSWNEKPGRWKALVSAIIVSAATWTHHFGWLALPVMLTVMLRRWAWRDALFASSMVFILYIPWMGKAFHQFSSFGGVAIEGANDLLPSIPISMRLAGAPLSVTGCILRFSAGTTLTGFGLFSIESVSLWLIPGLICMGLMTMSLLSNLRSRPVALTILLWVLLPLSLLRPSSRHFSLAFPAFVCLVSAGTDRIGKKWKPFPVIVLLLLPLMWIPLASRQTIPQRTSYHRDFREAAAVALDEADARGVPVVIDLDLYSTLALLYHIDQHGASSAVAWHPHMSLLEGESFFYDDMSDALAYLTTNTDSTVSLWKSEYGDMILIANDPGQVQGPASDAENGFIGFDSGDISDADLQTILSAEATMTELKLSHSRGPFSVWAVDFIE